MKRQAYGKLWENVTVVSVARILSRMRSRKTVKAGVNEFFSRLFAEAERPVNNSPAREYLPPRRKWVRLGPKQRRLTGPDAMQTRTVLATVRWHEKRGTLDAQDWGRKLLALTRRVRERMRSGGFRFDPPRMVEIPKYNSRGRDEKRRISVFGNIEDVLILAFALRALQDWIEPELERMGCCHSFRAGGNLDHNTAVKALLDWRLAANGKRKWVAECDIVKFFDNITHRSVLESLEFFGHRIGPPAEGCAGIVQGYLEAFSAGADGDARKGLPQGGALSVVLANIVMARVDEAVLAAGAGRDFCYARFCDDMVIGCTDRDLCERMTSAYLRKLEEFELPPHPVKDFSYGREYFETKSKGPFEWCESKTGDKLKAPWVSFLGSQISHDGEVRIRKDSIAKHKAKLKGEASSLIGRLKGGDAVLRTGITPAVVYRSFCALVIAQGVGRIRPGTKPKDAKSLFWAAAFPLATVCRSCRMQMRELDNHRERILAAVRKAMGGGDALKGDGYQGRPYSYNGFLDNLERRHALPGQKRPMRIYGYVYGERRPCIIITLDELMRMIQNDRQTGGMA